MRGDTYNGQTRTEVNLHGQRWWVMFSFLWIWVVTAAVMWCFARCFVSFRSFDQLLIGLLKADSLAGTRSPLHKTDLVSSSSFIFGFNKFADYCWNKSVWALSGVVLRPKRERNYAGVLPIWTTRKNTSKIFRLFFRNLKHFNFYCLKVSNRHIFAAPDGLIIISGANYLCLCAL